MILNGVEREAISQFWQLAGEVEDFPRRLERPLALALPVALVKLPGLNPSDIDRWIRRRGSVSNVNCSSRALRGCLVAQNGKGMLFLDGNDPEDEQRFTIAHEIAHFLLDYWFPRQSLIRQLGQGAVDIIDGLREPTVSERLVAILHDVDLGPYSSFMNRDAPEDGAAIWDAENRADRVAMALLAPQEAVLAHLDLATITYSARLEAAEETLRSYFRLPSQVCSAYARVVLSSVGRGPSWVEFLGIRQR